MRGLKISAWPTPSAPSIPERTIWDVFQEERASLMALRAPFDGFVEKAVRASTTCPIMADHNRYSVDARAAGRMVLVRSHAERIVVLPWPLVDMQRPPSNTDMRILVHRALPEVANFAELLC
jgi:hypothetical protein